MSEPIPTPLKLPRALYGCHDCASEYSWPADDMLWDEARPDSPPHTDAKLRVGPLSFRQKRQTDHHPASQPLRAMSNANTQRGYKISQHYRKLTIWTFKEDRSLFSTLTMTCKPGQTRRERFDELATEMKRLDLPVPAFKP